jgi:hypothetical protein
MHELCADRSGAGKKSRNMIVEELYDALIEAGASQEKARAASRAVADMEGHFAKIEKGLSELRSDVGHEILAFRSHVDHEITALRSDMNQGFTDIRGTLRLHNWMLGTGLALLIAVFFKVFSR